MRGSNMERPSPFTFAGRLLILLTIVLAIGGTAAFFWWIKDLLPPRRYPLFFFAMPVGLGAALFFCLGRAVMRWLQIPFWKE